MIKKITVANSSILVRNQHLKFLNLRIFQANALANSSAVSHNSRVFYKSIHFKKTEWSPYPEGGGTVFFCSAKKQKDFYWRDGKALNLNGVFFGPGCPYGTKKKKNKKSVRSTLPQSQYEGLAFQKRSCSISKEGIPNFYQYNTRKKYIYLQFLLNNYLYNFCKSDLLFNQQSNNSTINNSVKSQKKEYQNLANLGFVFWSLWDQKTKTKLSQGISNTKDPIYLLEERLSRLKFGKTKILWNNQTRRPCRRVRAQGDSNKKSEAIYLFMQKGNKSNSSVIETSNLLAGTNKTIRFCDKTLTETPFIASFFPYKKSFLCYWLLPFMGFVSAIPTFLNYSQSSTDTFPFHFQNSSNLPIKSFSAEINNPHSSYYLRNNHLTIESQMSNQQQSYWPGHKLKRKLTINTNSSLDRSQYTNVPMLATFYLNSLEKCLKSLPSFFAYQKNQKPLFVEFYNNLLLNQSINNGYSHPPYVNNSSEKEQKLLTSYNTIVSKPILANFFGFDFKKACGFFKPFDLCTTQQNWFNVYCKHSFKTYYLADQQSLVKQETAKSSVLFLKKPAAFLNFTNLKSFNTLDTNYPTKLFLFISNNSAVKGGALAGFAKPPFQSRRDLLKLGHDQFMFFVFCPPDGGTPPQKTKLKLKDSNPVISYQKALILMDKLISKGTSQFSQHYLPLKESQSGGLAYQQGNQKLSLFSDNFTKLTNYFDKHKLISFPTGDSTLSPFKKEIVSSELPDLFLKKPEFGLKASSSYGTLFFLQRAKLFARALSKFNQSLTGLKVIQTNYSFNNKELFKNFYSTNEYLNILLRSKNPAHIREHNNSKALQAGSCASGLFQKKFNNKSLLDTIKRPCRRVRAQVDSKKPPLLKEHSVPHKRKTYLLEKSLLYILKKREATSLFLSNTSPAVHKNRHTKLNPPAGHSKSLQNTIKALNKDEFYYLIFNDFLALRARNFLFMLSEHSPVLTDKKTGVTEPLFSKELINKHLDNTQGSLTSPLMQKYYNEPDRREGFSISKDPRPKGAGLVTEWLTAELLARASIKKFSFFEKNYGPENKALQAGSCASGLQNNNISLFNHPLFLYNKSCVFFVFCPPDGGTPPAKKTNGPALPFLGEICQDTLPRKPRSSLELTTTRPCRRVRAQVDSSKKEKNMETNRQMINGTSNTTILQSSEIKSSPGFGGGVQGRSRSLFSLGTGFISFASKTRMTSTKKPLRKKDLSVMFKNDSFYFSNYMKILSNKIKKILTISLIKNNIFTKDKKHINKKNLLLLNKLKNPGQQDALGKEFFAQQKNLRNTSTSPLLLEEKIFRSYLSKKNKIKNMVYKKNPEDLRPCSILEAQVDSKKHNIEGKKKLKFPIWSPQKQAHKIKPACKAFRNSSKKNDGSMGSNVSLTHERQSERIGKALNLKGKLGFGFGFAKTKAPPIGGFFWPQQKKQKKVLDRAVSRMNLLTFLFLKKENCFFAGAKKPGADNFKQNFIKNLSNKILLINPNYVPIEIGSAPTFPQKISGTVKEQSNKAIYRQKRISPNLLIKNRSFITCLVSSLPINKEGRRERDSKHSLLPNALANSGAVSQNNKLEKRHLMKKKHRRKKQKKENRRRKKRKRFYPRPLWLRFRLYKKFCSLRHNSSLGNKQLKINWKKQLIKKLTVFFADLCGGNSYDISKKFFNFKNKISSNIKVFPYGNGFLSDISVIPNIYALDFFDKQKNQNSLSFGKAVSLDHNLPLALGFLAPAKQQNSVAWSNLVLNSSNGAIFSEDPKLLNSQLLSKQASEIPILCSKEYYQVSRTVLGDLKRMFWKSYWIRSNLNPYLNRVKNSLSQIRESKKKWQLYTHIKSFLYFLFGISGVPLRLQTNPPAGPKQLSINQSLHTSTYWAGSPLNTFKNVLSTEAMPKNFSANSEAVNPPFIFNSAKNNNRISKNKAKNNNRIGRESNSYKTGLPKDYGFFESMQYQINIKPYSSISAQSTTLFKNIRNNAVKTAFTQIPEQYIRLAPGINFNDSNWQLAINMSEYNRILYERIQQLILNIRENCTLNGQIRSRSSHVGRKKFTFPKTVTDPWMKFGKTLTLENPTSPFYFYGDQKKLRMQWVMNKTNLGNFKDMNPRKMVWYKQKAREQSKSNKTKKILYSISTLVNNFLTVPQVAIKQSKNALANSFAVSQTSQLLAKNSDNIAKKMDLSSQLEQKESDLLTIPADYSKFLNFSIQKSLKQNLKLHYLGVLNGISNSNLFKTYLQNSESKKQKSVTKFKNRLQILFYKLGYNSYNFLSPAQQYAGKNFPTIANQLSNKEIRLKAASPTVAEAFLKNKVGFNFNSAKIKLKLAHKEYWWSNQTLKTIPYFFNVQPEQTNQFCPAGTSTSDCLSFMAGSMPWVFLPGKQTNLAPINWQTWILISTLLFHFCTCVSLISISTVRGLIKQSFIIISLVSKAYFLLANTIYNLVNRFSGSRSHNMFKINAMSGIPVSSYGTSSVRERDSIDNKKTINFISNMVGDITNGTAPPAKNNKQPRQITAGGSFFWKSPLAHEPACGAFYSNKINKLILGNRNKKSYSSLQDSFNSLPLLHYLLATVALKFLGKEFFAIGLPKKRNFWSFNLRSLSPSFYIQTKNGDNISNLPSAPGVFSFAKKTDFMLLFWQSQNKYKRSKNILFLGPPIKGTGTKPFYIQGLAIPPEDVTMSVAALSARPANNLLAGLFGVPQGPRISANKNKDKQKRSNFSISNIHNFSGYKTNLPILFTQNVNKLRDKQQNLNAIVLMNILKKPLISIKKLISSTNNQSQLLRVGFYSLLVCASFGSTINNLIFVGYKKSYLTYTFLMKSLDLLAANARSIYTFLEKPGELVVDWIAYVFLVEWASDLTTTIPETVDVYTWNSLYKFSRISMIFTTLISLFQQKVLALSAQSNMALLTSKIGSLFLFAAPLIQRRIWSCYQILLSQLCQPDSDLLMRQRKGIIFWDIWAELLIIVAEDSNINISELSNLKEEQTRLLDILLSTEFDSISLTTGQPSLLKETHYLQETNKLNNTASFKNLFGFFAAIGGSRQLQKTKKSGLDQFQKQTKEAKVSTNNGFKKSVQKKSFNNSFFSEKQTYLNSFANQVTNLKNFNKKPTMSGGRAALSARMPDRREGILQPLVSIHTSNYSLNNDLQKNNSWKDIPLKIDGACGTTKDMSFFKRDSKALNLNGVFFGPGCPYPERTKKKKNKKPRLLLAGFLKPPSFLPKTDFSLLKNRTDLTKLSIKSQNGFYWSANQFLSYQGKDTELFIDLHPPKSFSHLTSIRYSQSIQQPVGMMLCQIFSGIFYRQIAKNILVVGSSGIEKTLLIQAIAGESELKLITDNAHRYAMVYRGVAVGIKLLRDVFEALALHTPCIFLLEDIHAIGERRPFLISDQDTYKATETSFGSEREEIHEKNIVTYQLSKHFVTHYKKPYKGDFSLLIPTNHFCFDLFLGVSPPRTRRSYTTPISPLPLSRLKNKDTSAANNEFSDQQEGDYLQSNQSSGATIYLQSNQINFGFTFKKENREINTSGGSRKANMFLLVPSGPLASSLQLPSNQLLAPPATSPFSVLVLKEEKKFKPKKLVKEMPWAGFPGEQLALVEKSNYSIRVKVALLADMALSNLSVKLDMITDLLVIIDSVKGNRGFIVFGTTHAPYILDPALRRPGRFDETISLPIYPNLLSRLAPGFLAEPKKQIFKSNFATFMASLVDQGALARTNLDILNISSLCLSQKGNNSVIKQIQPNFIKDISIEDRDHKAPKVFVSLRKRKQNNIYNKKISILFKMDKTGYVNKIAGYKNLTAQMLNNKSIYKFVSFTASKFKVNKKLNSFIFCEGALAKNKNKAKSLSFISAVRPPFAHSSWSSGTAGPRSLLNQSINKNLTVKTKDNNTSLPKRWSPLAHEPACRASSKEHLFKNPNKTFINLLARTYFIVSKILIMMQFTEIGLYKNLLPFAAQAASPLFDSAAPYSVLTRSIEKNQQIEKPWLTASLLAKLNRKKRLYLGTAFRSNFNGEDSFIYTILFSPPSIFKYHLISLFAGKLGELFAFSNWHPEFERPLYNGFMTLQGIDKTWRSASSLLFSFIQKRYLYSKQLTTNRLFHFINNSSLTEVPSPPASNALLPAKRYFNSKRSFNTEQLKHKSYLSIQEKIQLHQQQRLFKRLYLLPIKEFFKSEILTSNLTSFGNSSIMLAPLETKLQKPTSINWYYRNIILNRHRNYLTNQWWNGQLQEHNAETTFLSDIDWRYSFVDSLGDILIDFPDSEQFYNPRNRRWFLTTGTWNNWKTFEQNTISEIYSHYLFECFVEAYNYLDKNRETLDFIAINYLKTGMFKELNLAKFKFTP